MALMDGTTLPVSCKCGYAEDKEIAWLKDNRSFDCPKCGTLLKLEHLEEAISMFEQLNKSAASSDITIGGKRQ